MNVLFSVNELRQFANDYLKTSNHILPIFRIGGAIKEIFDFDPKKVRFRTCKRRNVAKTYRLKYALKLVLKLLAHSLRKKKWLKIFQTFSKNTPS